MIRQRKPLFLFTPIALTLLALTLISGCDSEKIVQSTEYIEKIEYVELPPDTVRIIDTVTIPQSTVDTVVVRDTVVQQVTVYDTTVVTDTVVTVECAPDLNTAFGAVQYYTNDMVLEFINQQFGLSDGWVFYLTVFQSDVTATSPGSYEIYGLIDYWTPDWAEYYPLEYFWQVTHTGGDPANPQNWRLDEPVTGAVGKHPGLGLRARSGEAAQPGH